MRGVTLAESATSFVRVGRWNQSLETQQVSEDTRKYIRILGNDFVQGTLGNRFQQQHATGAVELQRSAFGQAVGLMLTNFTRCSCKERLLWHVHSTCFTPSVEQ